MDLQEQDICVWIGQSHSKLKKVDEVFENGDELSSFIK